MGGNFADGKGNATVFFSYKKDDALLQSERDFSACALGSSAGRLRLRRLRHQLPGPLHRPDDRQRSGPTADANGTARPFDGATDQYNFGPLNYYQRPSER